MKLISCNWCFHFSAELALEILSFGLLMGWPSSSLKTTGIGNLFINNLEKPIDSTVLYDMFSILLYKIQTLNYLAVHISVACLVFIFLFFNIFSKSSINSVWQILHAEGCRLWEGVERVGLCALYSVCGGRKFGDGEAAKCHI